MLRNRVLTGDKIESTINTGWRIETACLISILLIMGFSTTSYSALFGMLVVHISSTGKGIGTFVNMEGLIFRAYEGFCHQLDRMKMQRLIQALKSLTFVTREFLGT